MEEKTQSAYRQKIQSLYRRWAAIMRDTADAADDQTTFDDFLFWLEYMVEQEDE